MDLVIKEYEIQSRRDGVTLLSQLQEAGYNIKIVIGHMSKSARIPELSYYQVWSDGTITRDDVILDFPDVKSCNYTFVRWDNSVQVEDAAGYIGCIDKIYKGE